MSKSRYALALFSFASLAGLAQAALADDAGQPANVSEVVVTAAPREEVKARRVQHDAINIIDVQSAQTIAKYPDFNAAEALGRMPGVSISTDTGEGRFVNIRGIDGNLAGATFGGVPMLNTNPGGTYFGGGGRAVEYDTIPTGAIDGLVVTMTPLPDHEAESLGGTVELSPRTAADITKPFLDSTLGWGYENERNVTGPFDAELALGARFGFHHGLVVQGVNSADASGSGWISNPTPFSFVLTGSRMDDRRGFDDMEEDYNLNAAGTAYTRSYQDLQFRHYDYHRRRFGYGGEFDFQPNDNHHYYFRLDVAGYTESVIKNRLTFNFNSTNPPQDPATGAFADTASLDLSSTQEQETHRNTIYALGGQDRFGSAVLDYRVSYSRATYYQSYNYGSDWGGPTAAVTYNNRGNNGDFPALRITDGTNPNDPSLYTLAGGANSQEKDFDQEWAYAANLTLAPHLINENDQLKFGVEARLRDKDQTQASEQPSSFPPISLTGYANGADTNFYGHGYSNGPTINVDKVQALIDAAGGTYAAMGAYGLNFAATENIFAGYGQYQTKIGAWSFLAGVRVEATDARYSAYSNIIPPGSTASQVLVTDPVNYTNLFPTVQVRYDFSPRFLVRAIYSTGVGRPGFNQVAPATTSNLDVTNPQISTGNPNLKPTTGSDFDLSFEYYLPKGGIAEFGLFDKEFDNYIVTNYVRKLDTTPTDLFYNQIVGYTTFSNVQNAYARGLEASYHQQFIWLPGVFKGFGLDANATVVDSGFQEYSAAASATGKAQYGLLPGTSRLTANLAGFYEAYGVEARIAAEYVSKELFSLSGVGGAQALDSIQDNRLTLDWGSSYQFAPNWKFYFNVKNLTNEPLRFYVTSPSQPIQREFYDQTFEFGLKAHF